MRSSDTVTSLVGPLVSRTNTISPDGTSSVAVAAEDLNGDGIAELITGAGPGGGPHVRVWSPRGTGLVEVSSFYAYAPAFLGGVYVAR